MRVQVGRRDKKGVSSHKSVEFKVLGPRLVLCMRVNNDLEGEVCEPQPHVALPNKGEVRLIYQCIVTS